MAYILYGGAPADITVSRDTLTTGDQALDLAAGRSLEAWTAITSGSLITDLKLYDTGAPGTPGAAAPGGVFPSLADGTVLVWGQDNLDEFWVTGQGSGTQRWRLMPVKTLQRLRAAETSVSAFTVNSGGPYAHAPIARADKMIYAGESLGVSMVSLGGGTATLHDTTDHAIGSESAKVVTPVNASTGCGFAVFTGSTLPDMTGYDPVIWVKIAGMANTIDFTFWVGGSSLTNAYIWNLNESGTSFPYLRDGDWYRITLPLGKATINGSAPNLATLNSWQIRIFDNGISPITMQFGGWGYVPRQTAYPNGVVTLRFDDLFASCITTSAPKMAQYGFAGTAYAIAETLQNPGSFPTYATTADAHKLEEIFGWEVASHANTAALHNQTSGQGGLGTVGYTAYPAASQVADMKACRDYLRSEGYRAPDLFAWPQGAWDFTSRHSAQQVFTSAITLANHMHETAPPADPHRIRCYAPPNGVTGATLTAEVDKAIAGKQWLTFLFHNILVAPTGSPLDIGTTAFNTLIDYLNTNNVPVRLTSEVLKAV